jgi:cysteine desulfurase
MGGPVYLDNSATTALSEAALSAMTSAAAEFANPSSLHAAGMRARELVEQARARVREAAGLSPLDGWKVVFTGSGTEASNLAIAGAAGAKTRFESKRVIITDSEHPSVAETAGALSRLGFETVCVPTAGGALDLDALARELRRGAFLVSIMLVNNETGAVYDVEGASELVRSLCPGALFHVDAVQAFLRLPLTVRSCDMITVSAHKVHGPKGVGALLVSPDVIRRKAVSPVIRGGGQEEGLRSGTENVPGIAGFGAAAAEGRSRMEEDSRRLRALREYAVAAMTAAGAKVNEPVRRADHIISATLPGIKSQTMLSFLSERGICVSSGSACSSRSGRISGTLLAFGLDRRSADCTVRVSLCASNTEEDIDALCEGLRDGIGRLVRIR